MGSSRYTQLGECDGNGTDNFFPAGYMKIQPQSHLIPYFRPQDQSNDVLSPPKWLLPTDPDQRQDHLQSGGGAFGEQRYRYYLKSNVENDIYNAKRSMVSQREGMTGRLIDIYI